MPPVVVMAYDALAELNVTEYSRKKSVSIYECLLPSKRLFAAMGAYQDK